MTNEDRLRNRLKALDHIGPSSGLLERARQSGPRRLAAGLSVSRRLIVIVTAFTVFGASAVLVWRAFDPTGTHGTARSTLGQRHQPPDWVVQAAIRTATNNQDPNPTSAYWILADSNIVGAVVDPSAATGGARGQEYLVVLYGSFTDRNARGLGAPPTGSVIAFALDPQSHAITDFGLTSQPVHLAGLQPFILTAVSPSPSSAAVQSPIKVTVSQQGTLAATVQSSAIQGTPISISGSNGSAWVLASDQGQWFLEYVDSSGSVGSRLDVRGSPDDLAVADGQLWLSYPGVRGRLDRIDPATGRILDSAPGAMGRLAAEGDQIWGVTGPGTLGGLDVKTMAPLTPVDLGLTEGQNIVGRPVLADGSVWVDVVIKGGTQLIGVDAATGAIVARIDTKAFPGQLASGGGNLWLGTASGAIRIDAATHAVHTEYELPGEFLPFGAEGPNVWYASNFQSHRSYDVCRLNFDQRRTDCLTVPFASPADVHPATGLVDPGTGTIWIAQYQGSVTRLTPSGG